MVISASARGTSEVRMSRQDQTSPFRFAEIAAVAGVDFVHVSGMTEDKHFPTANGSGVAIFDYDGDGRLDLYFVTGTCSPSARATTGPNRLYKNLGGTHVPRRHRVVGPGLRGFCHGIVVGDIDNDGDPDVFLCNYGPNGLYRNNGDGTFVDISSKAGDRPPELVVRRRLPRLSTTTATSTSTSPTTASGSYPDDDTTAATRTEASGSTARPRTRSGRPSTSSTGTTATGPSPTCTTA